MQPLIIRKATADDLSYVQQLCDELIQVSNTFDPHYNLRWSFEPDGIKYLTSRIFDIQCVCFLAIWEERIVGYVTGAVLPIRLWRPIKQIELENLYIQKNYRKKGIGTRLVKELFLWGKEQKAQRVVVTTEAIDKHAIAFYQRNNFSPLHLKLEAVLDTDEANGSS